MGTKEDENGDDGWEWVELKKEGAEVKESSTFVHQGEKWDLLEAGSGGCLAFVSYLLIFLFSFCFPLM